MRRSDGTEVKARHHLVRGKPLAEQPRKPQRGGRGLGGGAQRRLSGERWGAMLEKRLRAEQWRDWGDCEGVWSPSIPPHLEPSLNPGLVSSKLRLVPLSRAGDHGHKAGRAGGGKKGRRGSV